MENITLEKIYTTNFDSHFSKYDLCDDFYKIPGEQHYRLLAYLSTLYNNTSIIEIGTHLGESAMALSYNPTNTIYTFDIVDKVSNEKKTVENISYQIGDLIYDRTYFDKWKEIILGSPFIFMDVDPHNGIMEIDFYNYLKEIGYTGYLVCDDIWYFKPMRDVFWNQVNYSERWDITEFGHWSGTGIVKFADVFTFPQKNDNSNWTLVTAYFNLTKCPDASVEIIERGKDYYMSHSLGTLCLPYNLVVYCDEESMSIIQSKRPEYLKSNTVYIVKEFDEFKIDNVGFADYRKMIIDNRVNHPYCFDNRNTASYYLFCMSRYGMLKEVIRMNPFGSTHFCWINFCIERMGFKNLIQLDNALSIKRDRFSTVYIDYIPKSLINNTAEYYKWGRCSMCSGFFTGNSEYMYKVCDLIEQQFVKYVKLGYGHADEQLYSPVYFDYPNYFTHYYGDYVSMITNYVYAYDNPEQIIHYFIRNSFNNGDKSKCIEACKFLLKSFSMNKCNLSTENLHKIIDYCSA